MFSRDADLASTVSANKAKNMAYKYYHVCDCALVSPLWSNSPKPMRHVIGSFSHTVLPAMQWNTGLENGVPEEKRKKTPINPVTLQRRKHVNKHLNRKKNPALQTDSSSQTVKPESNHYTNW